MAQSLRRIFISYTAADTVFGNRLAADLRQALGNAVEISSEPWQNDSAAWNATIAAISASDTFLVILSPDAAASHWMQDEVDLAWRQKNMPRGKRIIPVLYRNTAIREDLRSIQFVSFLTPRPYQAAFQELLTALATPQQQRLPPASKPQRQLRFIPLALVTFVVIAALIGMYIIQHAGNATGSVSAHQGPQPCPSTVRAAAYWESILHIVSGGDTTFGSIQCAYLTGDNTLQAVVTEISVGSGGFRTAHVFDALTSTAPKEIFTLPNVADGAIAAISWVGISHVNTLLTGEIDPSSSINHFKPNADQVVDVFSEYAWLPGQNTFQFVQFGGIFPDLTRAEAETHQLQSHDAWRADSTQVVTHFANTFLHWQAPIKVTIQSGGSKHDTQGVATINATNSPDHQITLHLQRLGGFDNTGVWEIIAVSSVQATLNITNQQLISSPLQVGGLGPYNEQGTIEVVDHLYALLGQSPIIVQDTNGSTGFSASCTYMPTFGTPSPGPGNSEAGVVVLLLHPAGSTLITDATVIKVALK